MKKFIKSMEREVIITYLGFFLNGFLLLSIGAIMPDLMKNLDLSFSSAGFLLSIFMFGNMMSNFIFPFVSEKIAFKKAALAFIVLIPLGFFVIFLFQQAIVNVLWLIFFLLGHGNGVVNIVSNTVINDLSEDETFGINILHTSFAVGAFLAPFIIVSLKNIGFDFNHIILFIFLAMASQTLLFSLINFNYQIKESDSEVSVNKKLDFYFLTVALVLFFYLGVENTINGWLMTYLQDLNILSETFSASLVSLTWLMIMVGRIFTAVVSKKINGLKLVIIYSIGVTLMLPTLILTRNPLIITITILALGFFLAGIYPTSVSNASDYVKGSPKRLSILFLSAGIGGMVTPQIVGLIADKTSISFAISILPINAGAMLLFAFLSYRKS